MFDLSRSPLFFTYHCFAIIFIVACDSSHSLHVLFSPYNDPSRVRCSLRIIITHITINSFCFICLVITSQYRCSKSSSSHSRFRRSKPLLHLRSAFRAIVITFQYRCSEPSSSHSRFWCSEPSPHLRSAFRAITSQFGVQSHHRSQFWRSEPSSLFSFGVQSHHYFQFGVQSLHHFSFLAFKAIIASQFWHS